MECVDRVSTRMKVSENFGRKIVPCGRTIPENVKIQSLNLISNLHII